MSCFVVKTLVGNRVIFASDSLEKVSNGITSRYNRMISTNGVGQCFSITKQPRTNRYKVATIYTDKNDNVHSTNVFYVEEVDFL